MKTSATAYASVHRTGGAVVILETARDDGAGSSSTETACLPPGLARELAHALLASADQTAESEVTDDPDQNPGQYLMF
ncbi:hypothetical protein [Streptomyces sp. AJS327]|uniref:hypothetical protein n=1 Tax=Streptomyces sp. AJS327 TaxID=2545265 RepID=UPI001C60D5C0|nr:hypothetical protein [Streptomyces sp. AJS327]